MLKTALEKVERLVRQQQQNIIFVMVLMEDGRSPFDPSAYVTTLHLMPCLAKKSANGIEFGFYEWQQALSITGK